MHAASNRLGNFPEFNQIDELKVPERNRRYQNQQPQRMLYRRAEATVAAYYLRLKEAREFQAKELATHLRQAEEISAAQKKQKLIREIEKSENKIIDLESEITAQFAQLLGDLANDSEARDRILRLSTICDEALQKAPEEVKIKAKKWVNSQREAGFTEIIIGLVKGETHPYLTLNSALHVNHLRLLEKKMQLEEMKEELAKMS